MPRLLLSSRPWWALAYLASGIPLGILVLTVLPPALLGGLGLVPLGVGIPIVLAVALAGIPVGVVERHRLRLVDRRSAPSPHRWVPERRGWLSIRLREAATWQELAFAMLAAVVLWPVELLVVAVALVAPAMMVGAPLVVRLVPADAVPNLVRLSRHGLIWFLPPLGVVVAAGMAYVVVEVARLRAALVRAVLVAPAAGPTDEQRLVELTRSRSRLVRGFDDERRRLERDLHDGVQQRLLALSVTLGLARLDASGRTATVLAGAHEESKAILAQLRQLVRGVHPWLLTDRGLPAAIEELAGRSTVPVHPDVALPGRFPGIVESTAYFVVSEALANVERHSGADRAVVVGRYADGLLTLDVRDSGRGGADPARGSGLRGLADRAEAAGARLLVSSPPGGPTLLRLEIPCTPVG